MLLFSRNFHRIPIKLFHLIYFFLLSCAFIVFGYRTAAVLIDINVMGRMIFACICVLLKLRAKNKMRTKNKKLRNTKYSACHLKLVCQTIIVYNVNIYIIRIFGLCLPNSISGDQRKEKSDFALFFIYYSDVVLRVYAVGFISVCNLRIYKIHFCSFAVRIHFSFSFQFA